MEKVEHQINQLEDFLQLPLIDFLHWLSPNAFDISSLKFELQLRKFENQQDNIKLDHEENIKLVRDLLEPYKLIYQNTLLGFLKPYLNRPLGESLQKVNELKDTATENDFLIANLSQEAQDIIFPIITSKQFGKILDFKSNMSFLDILWSFNTFRSSLKLNSLIKSQFGSEIIMPQLNRYRLRILLYKRYIKGDKTIKPLREFFGNAFAELIERIAEYHKVIKIYPELLETYCASVNQLEQSIMESPSQQEVTKIEWLGSQKELAELFLELKRKGFVAEIPTQLIKQYFTKSDTIEQVLKPSQDPKTKENTYEGIYTKAYRPHFDTIRQKS